MKIIKRYSRAVLRCLGSGEDAHLTVQDLNVWLNFQKNIEFLSKLIEFRIEILFSILILFM